MLKRLEFGVVIVFGLALIAAVAASGHVTLTGPGTIKITDRLVKRTHVDGGKKGRGAGDFDFYRESLFNKGITSTSIGHSDLTCIDTGTGSMNCSGTYLLPRGKIMVEGVIGSRFFYELAVVGGTQLYDNVRGSVTVTSLGGSPLGEFLVFRLVV
ncbi:MAG TPA: hypothetical protein VGM80_07400 [Gaiellaceae bacterium]|jgi:hypothetical protein